MSGGETKRCPYCAEVILTAAIRCKHCGMMLDGSAVAVGSTPGRPGTAPPGLGSTPGTGPGVGWTHTNAIEVGTVVREYTLDKLLGKGGMGEVYRAVHIHTGQRVAIKILYPELLRDEQGSARFVEEARVMAGMRHPNIVQFIDFFEEGGRYFLVMEYIDGPTLEDLLEQRPLEWKEAVKTGAAVLSALDYAHTRPQPVIHRDIKPANIMLTRDDRVVITDFGVAKAVGRERLTKIRGVVGTYEYMSPEQVQGEEVSPATDVYAFGITLYRMLTGVVPFPQKAESGIGCMNAHLKAPVPSLAEFREGLPGWFQAVVEKALAKAPSDRYASAGEMKQAMAQARAQAERPPTRPEPPRVEPSTREAQPEIVDDELSVPAGRTGLWLGLGATLIIVVGSVVGLGFLGNKGAGKQPVEAEKQWTSAEAREKERKAQRMRTAEEQKKRKELERKLKEEEEEKTLMALELEEARRRAEKEKERRQREEEEATERLKEEKEAAHRALLLNLPSNMVLIEEDRYSVGCFSGNDRCFDDEKPPRTVSMKAFGIMKHEVTMEEYDICVGEEACPKAGKNKRCNWQKSGRENHPMNCVGWSGASAYCAHKGWRLPTEEEWEAAARGGETKDYPWGNAAPDCKRTVMKDGSKGGCGIDGTRATGYATLDRSWADVMDMGGSVREWVSSPYEAYPGGTVDSGMKGMVNRGGSWLMDAASFSTSHTRNSDAVDEKRPDLGFRCAVSL